MFFKSSTILILHIFISLTYFVSNNAFKNLTNKTAIFQVLIFYYFPLDKPISVRSV